MRAATDGYSDSSAMELVRCSLPRATGSDAHGLSIRRELRVVDLRQINAHAVVNVVRACVLHVSARLDCERTCGEIRCCSRRQDRDDS